jgi:predicted LPLAT superfamily acyltransferase
MSIGTQAALDLRPDLFPPTLEEYCRKWPYQWFNLYDFWDA